MTGIDPQPEEFPEAFREAVSKLESAVHVTVLGAERAPIEEVRTQVVRLRMQAAALRSFADRLARVVRQRQEAGDV